MVRASCKEQYAKWIEDLAGYLHIFGTFTFPGQVRRSTAYRRGMRLWRLTNELACGRRWREHKDGLATVFTVEASHGMPHLHFIQESHPALDFRAYRELWGLVSNARLSEDAVRIEQITSPDKVAAYVTKRVTWENPPFVSIPARVNYELRE